MSDDAERSLLVKLKTECGYQFTSKLESMFTDIKTSRDTMADFRARRAASGLPEPDIELSVQVGAGASLEGWGVQNIGFTSAKEADAW